MKTSLRKLVAMICVLAIAAVLPVMASAAETSLTITADKTNVKAGDEVTVSFTSAGLSDTVYWNLFEFAIGYDDTQLEHVMQGSGRDALPYIAGSALYKSATVEVNEKVNPILGACIDASENQYDNGTIMQLVFKVKDGVADGTKINIEVNLKAFAQSIVENGQSKGNEPLEDAGITNIELTVGEATQSTESTAKPTESTAKPTESTAKPTESTAKPTESTAKPTESTAAPTVAPTQGTVAPTVAPVVTDTDDTEATDADVTTATDAEEEGDVVTGESSALIVLALVLMAGSAVALISMKKKALSK